MVLAMYFSRYLIAAAPPISEHDKNYVINIINSFNYIQKSTQRITTDKRATKTSKRNDVLGKIKQSSKSKHGFSPNRYQN